MKSTAKTPLLLCAAFLALAMSAFPGAGEEREKIELKPALVVIDIQNVWMPKMAEEDVGSAPQKINEAIALFREFGLPVIRVYHTNLERGPRPDTEPFEFPDSIAVTDDDPKIVKSRPSAFIDTDLEQVLRKRGRNTVFLCGLSATGCVLATYFGAKEHDFISVMIDGALLSGDASYTKMIEDICNSMTLEEVRETLKDPYL
jgi:nicotinamidase-related amidase